MSTYEMRDDHQRRAYSLVVAGLDVEYTTHNDLPTRALPDSGAGDYERLATLTYLSPMGGRLDTTQGIAEYDTISITLSTLGPNARSEYDAGRVFGRIGYRDADNYARLITTVAEATGGSPATLEVDRDVSGWGYPRTIHGGKECFAVTGGAGAGTGADPYRFTGVTRAQRGTAPERHVTNDNSALRPWVTSHQVWWAWQRCTLYCRPVRPDGSYGDEFEVMRGYIEGPCTINGPVVSLAMLPLTAVLDRKVASTGETVRLEPGHHFTEGSAACILEHVQRWPEGNAYLEQTTAADNAGLATLTAPTAPYSGVFDITLADDHPRHGRLIAGVLVDQAPSAIAGAGQFTLNAGQPTTTIQAATLVKNAECAEVVQSEIVDPVADTSALKEWPKDYLAQILTDWTPGVHTGASGQWADIRLRNLRITGEYNGTYRNGPMDLIFYSDSNTWDAALGEEPAGRARFGQLLHYPIDFAAPDDPRHAPAYRPDASDQGQHWNRRIPISRASTFARPGFEIRGICPGGWYQSGERYILADGDILIPSSGTAVVEITYFDRARQEQRHATCRIISSTAQATGYALEVHEQDRARLPSFGDWGEAEPVTIKPAVHFNEQPARNVLLTVLHSNGGNLATDAAWDREAFGAGLLTADVDRGSFNAINPPPGLNLWSPYLEQGKTLRGLIEPILQATSSALVMRRDEQGRCRLTLISVGFENATESIETIGNDDWVSDPWPMTSADTQVTNYYKLSTNHLDGGRGDAATTLTFEDRASIAANGEGETLEVELRGLYVDNVSTSDTLGLFRDMIARWSELKGYVRKRWEGDVSLGKAWRIGLGSTVTVTSDVLRAQGAGFGPSAVPARVVEYRAPLWPSDGGSANLVMVSHGVNASGWNAAMQVSSVVDATRLVVKSSVFSPSENPATGESITDLDFFSVGDAIDRVGQYDQDAFTSASITAINRTTREITTAAAHGASAGDYIEPRTYDNASTTVQLTGITHKGLCFTADSNGQLGAANDTGITLV